MTRVLVVGAGSIGGITAALCKQAGHDVTIVCKYPELVPQIQDEGLRVFGVCGEHQISMPAVATIAELDGRFDTVLLAVKATDMLAAAKQLLPLLHERSAVVSLQNGICEHDLAQVLGAERVIGAVVGYGATMHAPGELEMTSHGEYIIGTIDGRPDDRLDAIAELLSAVVPTSISTNIIGALYAKLIINSCITAMGAVCGLYLGEMLSRRPLRAIFIEVIREAMAVAQAMELRVEVYGGKLDYYRFIAGDGWWAGFKRHAMIRLIGFKYRRLKSSSLQSLERGKPTEIDWLNGYIVARGAEHGIATPVNRRIVEQIKEIEAGQRTIAPGNFAEDVYRP